MGTRGLLMGVPRADNVVALTWVNLQVITEATWQELCEKFLVGAAGWRPRCGRRSGRRTPPPRGSWRGGRRGRRS